MMLHRRAFNLNTRMAQALTSVQGPGAEEKPAPAEARYEAENPAVPPAVTVPTTPIVSERMETSTPVVAPAPVQPTVRPTAPPPKAPAVTGSFFSAPRNPSSGAPDGSISRYYNIVREQVYAQLNVSAALTSGRERMRGEVSEIVTRVCSIERLPVTGEDQGVIVEMLIDDMFGIGPLEPLLSDETISDILVNGPFQVYVERRGKLELTDVRFRDEQHLVNVAQRIATTIGRRVDESSPMVDARLADGSRVNIVLKPLALDGASISIRKFARRKIDFNQMVLSGSISPKAAKILEIAGACRLNIIVSGGTGSGKTTMMNAVSSRIGERERVVTIEDAAELQLQQPHLVRLESRPPNSEGVGEVTIRDLLRNSLRMRPDRIIIGECRGAEAFDLLQAMNTGHDGSMSTIHANSPRDALVRLENMVLMANDNLPMRAIRQQISSAVNMIVQLERMRDGVRRVQAITEVVGMEGDVVITQDLFWFEFEKSTEDGRVEGVFKSSGVRPAFLKRAAIYGLDGALMECMR